MADVLTIPADRIAGTSLPYKPCLNEPVQTNTSEEESPAVDASFCPFWKVCFIHSLSLEAFLINFSDLLSGCHISSSNVVVRPKFANRPTANGATGVCSEPLLELFESQFPLSSNVRATHRSFGSISIPGGGSTTGRSECSCASFDESEVIDIVAMLSSSICKSETRKNEQQRRMIRDFAEDIVLLVVVGRNPSQKKLQPILERADGLGLKETLPS
mmetsp:Transcript_20078/g.47092  ORF Transcript_20078/g.47092 Transcript_20078/m.47092 type:complete len:216 (+) Transcript_20078:890-1537(+)